MTTRVYVPSTLDRLSTLLSTGLLGPAPLAAHAVTDAVRAELPGEEDQVYAVTAAAALASVRLLTGDGPARRVVLAVDVPGVDPAAGRDGTVEADPSLVSLPDEVPLRWVGAVLADSRDAELSVARARDALGTATEDRMLEACLDHELGWWAVQESDVLVAESRGV